MLYAQQFGLARSALSALTFALGGSTLVLSIDGGLTMNVPSELLLAAAFFSFFAVASAVKAYMGKEKEYYYGIMVSSFMLLVVLSLILNQRQLAIILFSCMAVLGIAAWPRAMKFLERKGVSRLQAVDLSSPLRRRDFLSERWLLRVAYRWGIRKSLLLFCLVCVAIHASVLIILSLRLNLSIIYIVSITAANSTVATVTYYRVISAVFKKADTDVVTNG